MERFISHSITQALITFRAVLSTVAGVAMEIGGVTESIPTADDENMPDLIEEQSLGTSSVASGSTGKLPGDVQQPLDTPELGPCAVCLQTHEDRVRYNHSNTKHNI